MGKEYPFIPSGPIHKYADFETAYNILNSSSFKFTCPLDFNDPFDCNLEVLDFSPTKESEELVRESIKRIPQGTEELKESVVTEILDSPEEFRKMYRQIIKAKIKRSGVTCFSKSYENTLMWSHYANKHQGVCLEFNSELDIDNILKTQQVGIFVNVDYEPVDKINYNENKVDATVQLFSHKSADWKYEEEVRLVVINQKDTVQFTKEFLTGVIFGCRMEAEQIDELKEVIEQMGYSVSLKDALSFIRRNFLLLLSTAYIWY
ncbi:MAG: DUF2971 domain-containing protein [Flavobacteriales bacterium]|nr:DUF2971 domain-containing protein [Flavobacteriales bacterium]